MESPPSSPAHPYRQPQRSSSILAEVELVPEPYPSDVDGPSNAQVMCAGIRARGTVTALVCAELAWIGYQLGSQLFAGRSFDPAPFPLLQRANAVLVVVVLLIAARARRDGRRQERARRERAELRRARAEAVRATILVSLCEQRARESGLTLH